MTKEHKQSSLSKARSFKHSKTTSRFFCIQFITNEQVKLVSFTWEGWISSILILAVPLTHGTYTIICLQECVAGCLGFFCPRGCCTGLGRDHQFLTSRLLHSICSIFHQLVLTMGIDALNGVKTHRICNWWLHYFFSNLIKLINNWFIN